MAEFVSSRNALKTGLTGRTVLLPTDDLLNTTASRSAAAITPSGRPRREKSRPVLVDIDWRLDRVVALETGIYAKGLIEFADKFEDQPAATATFWPRLKPISNMKNLFATSTFRKPAYSASARRPLPN